jgi:hypothetical protein
MSHQEQILTNKKFNHQVCGSTVETLLPERKRKAFALPVTLSLVENFIPNTLLLRFHTKKILRIPEMLSVSNKI